MTQESRLVIRVDSKLSEQQVKDLDKALMLLERTGLSVTRTAKTTSAEITALGRESDTATRSIDRATAVWSKFNSVVALAGVGLSAVSAINMYKSVAANVESLRLFSEQIGISTEQLSSLRYAADDMAGVSSRTLDPALRRMTRRIQEAANESGPAASALKMLRLEAKALSELDVENQLYAVADALKDLPNHADKLRATMALFDTEGMPLVNMLNQGADAIKEAQLEAERLNQTISQVDADRVGRLNSEFSKLSARLDGIKTQSMLGFLPVVEDLNTGLNVLADNFDAITAVVGGAGLVALSRYTGGLIETRVETIKNTLGKRNAVRTELELARAQQLQTAETLRQTLALNAQNVTRTQTQAAIQADIAARARLTAAEAAMTRQVTASTAAMGLARSALGLVGGPFGALTLAVTAGTAVWYQHQSALRETRQVLEEMQRPIDELAEKIRGLSRDQIAALLVTQEAALTLARESAAEAKSELETALALMGDSFKGTRAELGAFINQITQTIEEGENLHDVLDEAVRAGRIPKPVSDSVISYKSSWEQAVEVVDVATNSFDYLTQTLDGLTESAHGAAGGIANLNTELSEAAEEGKKYLERLADQALTAGIDTHVGRLKKLVEAGKLEYSDEDFKKALQYAQHMDSVANSGKKAASGVKQLSNEIDNLIGSLFPVIKAEQDWVKQQKLLDDALKKGKLTKEQHAKGLVKIREQYELIAFVAPDHVKAIQDEAKSIKASIPSLRQRVDTFGLSAAVISRSAEAETKARIATLNNVKAVEVAKGASKEYVKQIEQEIEALKELLIQQEHQTGLLEKSEQQEAEQKYYQDMADTAKRAHEEIERSLTDALMRGFESGKDFGRNFIDTLKNMFGSLVLRPIIQPIAAGAAGLVTGALGMGTANAQGAGGIDPITGLSTAKNLMGGLNWFTDFSGSMGNSLMDAGMYLQKFDGIVGDFGNTVLGNIDTIAGAANIAGAAWNYGKGIYDITKGNWGAGIGSIGGQLIGGPIGGMIGNALGGMLDGAFKGETRSGGGFIRQNEETRFMGGPSGGYGGAMQAVDQVLAAATSTVDSLFNALDIDGRVDYFLGSFESSKKGRGGTQSGGAIVLGDEYLEFGVRGKGSGYGGKSGSAEEMFESMTKDMSFSILEAWQLAADQMPGLISDMLNAMDIRSLGAEQAQAAVAEITNIVGSVNALTVALNQLPMLNLQELTFDAKAGLNEVFGGFEQATAGIGLYYQEFYSESERAAHATKLLTAEFNRLGYELPENRDALREIIDGLDLSTREGQELYAQMISLAPAFASVTQAAEGFSVGLNEVSELMQLLSGLPFNHLREMGEDAVRVLSDLSGGVEAFSHNLSAYYQGFFSEQERFVSASAMLVTDLSDLGLSLPATAAGFRGMMDSIDMTTQAGQELFAALLGTADQAASYYRYVEQETSAALSALEQRVNASRQAELAALKAEQADRLQALRQQHSDERNELRSSQTDRMKALREAQAAQVKAVRDSYAKQSQTIRDSMASVSEKLRELSTLSSRITSSMDALRGYSDLAVDLHRQASLELVHKATQLAQAGKSLTGFAGLEDAVNALGRLDASDFNSLFDYELERAESVYSLKQLEELTGGQIDVQELQLSAMERQLEGLELWRDKQLEALERISEQEHAHLQDLFDREQAALEKYAATQISEMQSIFEQEQDALGKRFDSVLEQEKRSLTTQVEEMLLLQANQAALANIVESTSLQQYAQLVSIESAIGSAASRIASAVSNISVSVNMGMPAFADGGRYGGGLALVGERGPEIINFDKPGMVYTAAQSRNLMANAGAGNDEVAGLLRQLIGEMKEMRYELRQVAVNTQKTNNMLDDVTQGGTELRTKEVKV